MPELPGPPEDYDDEQRDAWLAGAATVANLLSQQNAIIAGAYAEDSDDLEPGGRDGAHPDANEDDEECPECGGTLIEQFGGAVCTNCSHEPD